MATGCHPPREAGSAPMIPRLPAGCSSGFLLPRDAMAADVAALASRFFLGVLSPKGSWDGVDDAALPSG